MVMKGVTVRYRQILEEPSLRDAAERAHRHHVGACGVARSVMPALAIDTELEVLTPAASAPA
jgi:hypothetical protein